MGGVMSGAESMRDDDPRLQHERLRVLVVTSGLGTGGAETQLLQVLPRLDSTRFDVRLASLRGHAGNEARLRAAGIEVLVTGGAGSVRRALNGVPRLYACMRRWRPDIAHFFLPEAYLAGGLAALAAPVRRRVMSRRSLDVYQRNHPLLARVERWLHGRMDCVLGNSRAVVRQLAGEGVPAARLGLLYNGVDTHRFAPDARRRVTVRETLGLESSALLLVCVANLIPYKGHADLLRALARARAELPAGWRVLCVGRDDGAGAALRRLADELGLGASVCWAGERADVADLLAAADIGVLCSHQEGFSNSVLEAMASALPLVLTDVGGNAEAIGGGDCGLLVEPGDVDGIAAALVRLGGDTALRRRFGTTARERACRSFSLESCVQAHEALYADLAAGVVAARLRAGAMFDGDVSRAATGTRGERDSPPAGRPGSC